MAASFPNFKSDSNSDYPNQALTFISEYPKLADIESVIACSGDEKHREGKANAIDQLGERAFGRAAGISGERDVLCRNCGCDQRQVQDRLFPQRRNRSQQANGVCRPRPRQGFAQTLARAVESPTTAAAQIARTPCARVHSADAEFERKETLKLRCVEIDPRHLSLTDLEPDDCRYPYGGEEESEAITFCGHPRRQGSSYCAPHFHLTRGPGTASERAAGSVLLRLVERHETRKPSHDEGGHHKAAAASPSHRAFA
jgi:hypothetical protein